MAETLTIRTASSTEVVKIAVQGPQGATGAGVPTGGSTGQVLRKASGANYDTEWAAAGSGSGSVTSVALASSDFTISGSPITDAGTITANLGNTGVTAGTYTKVTVDAKGRVTTGEAATASDVGAANALTIGSAGTLASDITLTATRNVSYTYNVLFGGPYNITLPISNNQSGDTVEILTGATFINNVVIRQQNHDGTDGTPQFTTLATLVGGSPHTQQRAVFRKGSSSDYGTWQALPASVHTHAASAITSGTLAHERGGLEADVSAYNGLVKISGGSTSAVTVTAAGEALLDDATNADQRTTLGLGNSATLNTGTTIGTVAAGDDSRITGAAQKSANLSDLASASTARTNLGVAIGTDVAAASHAHGNLTSGGAIGSTAGLPVVTTTSGAVTTLALGTANQVLKVNSGGTAVEFGAAGGVTSGSVDNAVLRADGVGGSTSQSSDINIEDASTTTQNNVAITNQHSGQTNSALVLTPKGNGAFYLGPSATGTTAGGNARGQYAVDLQWSPRFAATNVASGNRSIILNGENNTSSGSDAVSGGTSNVASGVAAIALGYNATSSGNYSFSSGYRPTASGANGTVALGANVSATINGQFAFSSGRPSVSGISQFTVFTLYGNTTTNSAVELFAGADQGGSIRFSIPSGHVMTGLVHIVGSKSDGAAVASYMRQVTIKNVGGTTSLVGTVNTVGTDEAAGTSISITANDTNDALKVECTGVASETWRWIAAINFAQRTYAN